MVKVAIVGAGNVGTKLGARLDLAGHAVKYGVRDVAGSKVKAVLRQQPATSAASVSDAVHWADAVILATPGEYDMAGMQKLAACLGPHIKGKVLLDATNPLTAYPALEVHWDGTSGGEMLAQCLPHTHVFKAFNTLGAELMMDPQGKLPHGEPLSMLMAGGPQGRGIAEAVVQGVGFRPEYVGPIRYARNLEAIAELWIHLGTAAGHTKEKWGRGFHFQVARFQE